MKKIFAIIGILAVLSGLSACRVAEAKETVSAEITATSVSSVTEESITEEETTTEVETTTAIADIVASTKSYLETTFGTTKERSSKSTTKTFKETTSYSVISTTERTTRKLKKLPNYKADAQAIDLFNAVNEHREKNGVKPVEWDDELAALAYIRAKEQVEVRGHERPDGAGFYEIADEYGYSFVSISENIAIGKEATTERMLDGWITSKKGHGQNMINGKWVKSGMGHYRDENNIDFFVQLFAN